MFALEPGRVRSVLCCYHRHCNWRVVVLLTRNDLSGSLVLLILDRIYIPQWRNAVRRHEGFQQHRLDGDRWGGSRGLLRTTDALVVLIDYGRHVVDHSIRTGVGGPQRRYHLMRIDSGINEIIERHICRCRSQHVRILLLTGRYDRGSHEIWVLEKRDFFVTVLVIALMAIARQACENLIIRQLLVFWNKIIFFILYYY